MNHKNLLISGSNINSAVFNIFDAVMNSGLRSPSRNGDISVIYNTNVEITNPKSRHLSLIGRKNNIFGMIAETLWTLSGSNDINGYMSFFIPRSPDFSDDGKTWRGGYGPRLYQGDQLQGVIDIIRNDGPATRRALIDIYDPNLDSPASLKSVYGLDSSKDIPCNNMLHFYTMSDEPNGLCMRVTQRSGDAIWGMGSINIFLWTVLQEIVANELDMSVRHYDHNVINLHVYDFTSQQAVEVLNTEQPYLGFENSVPLVFPSGISAMREFCQTFVSYVTAMINDPSSVSTIVKEVHSLLRSTDIPLSGNLLVSYVEVVLGYVVAKLAPEYSPTVSLFKSNTSAEFLNSIMHSPFRKFDVEIIQG